MWVDIVIFSLVTPTLLEWVRPFHAPQPLIGLHLHANCNTFGVVGVKSIGCTYLGVWGKGRYWSHLKSDFDDGACLRRLLYILIILCLNIKILNLNEYLNLAFCPAPSWEWLFSLLLCLSYFALPFTLALPDGQIPVQIRRERRQRWDRS